MAIRPINVQNAARKNMSHLPANADYAHHVEQSLFAASKITMDEMVASSNKKSKKKTKLKIGMIQVLQTFGLT